MRLHRFYVNPEHQKLDHTIWIKDEALRKQWQKVLRYKPGDEVVLFDGVRHDRLYKIEKIADDAIHVEWVTDFERTLPDGHLYLFFSLLKKDKNDWVLQKGTELGVRNFIPLIAARSEKTGFNIERAQKIIIEASEQCGRSDIPNIREPLQLETALAEYQNKVQLLVADGEMQEPIEGIDTSEPIGVFIGPEGGWTEEEKAIFKSKKCNHMHLGKLTLRAETAAVTAITKLASL